jgi:hypothetical protein
VVVRQSQPMTPSGDVVAATLAESADGLAWADVGTASVIENTPMLVTIPRTAMLRRALLLTCFSMMTPMV